MNVLVVRPDGIGDVLFSLPVATQLKQLRPNVRVGFLVSPTVAPILDRHPDVDYVRTIRWADPFKDVRAAFADSVEAVIFLKPFRRLMWAAFLERIPLRVATGYRWYSLLANRRIYEHRSDFSRHESEYNVGMLKALGLAPMEVVPPVLALTESEREFGRECWKSDSSRRVIIHPGGVSARRWKPEHYRDLALMLADRGFAVGLTGSRAERDRFLQEVGPTDPAVKNLHNFMGTLSVRELMAVISGAHVVVSGATGPAHLAAALNVATVSLYDPRRNNLPTRWKPLGRGLVLSPDVPTCEHCIGEACRYWDCLDRLTVDEVAGRIGDAIASPTKLRVLSI